MRTVKRWIWGIMMMLMVGCSGSGGSGTQDYRPDFWEDQVPGSEGFEERINYPQGYVPPEVIIDEPAGGSVIPLDQETVFVRAHVNPGEKELAYVRLNGEYFEPGTDGALSGYVPLENSGKGFGVIEASAVDADGYAGRDRIALLRGDTVQVEEIATNAVGLRLDQGLLDWAAALDPALNIALDGMQPLEFDMAPLLVEITQPFQAALELAVTGISVGDPSLAIRQLQLKNPTDTGLRLLADLGLTGIVIEADARFISLSGLPLPAGLEPVHITIAIDDLLGDLQISLPDPRLVNITVSLLDIDIDDLVLDLPTGTLLTHFSEFLGVTPEKYLLSIPVQDWLADLVSNVLNGVVNNQGLGLAIHLPDLALNLGTLLDMAGGIPDGLPQGMADMTLGLEIESLAGDASRLGVDLGLTGWVEDSSALRDYDTVLSLPPTITLAEALSFPDDSSLSLALSGNALNRILTALVDADFALDLKLGGLLPGLGLPADTLAHVALKAPPIMDIRDGSIRLTVPNLRVDLTMNTAEQLSLALDLVITITPAVVIRDGNPYLSLDLSMEQFRVAYLADRLGINRVLDIETAVKKLLPQIMAKIEPTLETTPLKITRADLIDLTADLDTTDPDNAKLQHMINALPVFTFSIQGLKAQGGYLGVFIDQS